MSERDDRYEHKHLGPPPARRHVVLVGLPGVGKSRIGLSLARELRRPFIDSDTALGLGVGHRVGIDQVLDDAERTWFFRVASSSLCAVIAAPTAILSGSIDDSVRRRLWVVFLDASLATIEKRLNDDASTAATLRNGDTAIRAGLERNDRRHHERARQLSDFTYDCTKVDPDVAAEVIARRWQRDHAK